MAPFSTLRRWWTSRQAVAVQEPVVDRARTRRRSEFAAFQTYLETRYADDVVLSFGQIEDLLGAPLPAEARTQPLWWLGREPAAARYALCWRSAGRTAKPNIAAHHVDFERVEDSSE